MELEVIAESSFEFSIILDGRRHFLKQDGGPWYLDNKWIASVRIDWPEALARALREVTGRGFSNRIVTAINLRRNG